MATCVFSTNSISGTNSDKKRGGTVTGDFYLSSGTLPPAGSTLQGVTVYFSNVVIYTTTAAGFSTVYGSVDLDLSSGSHTCTMYNPSTSLLNFTGGSITFTVTGGGSTTSNVLNVRTGSYITITVTYLESNPSTGSLSAASVAQGGSITLTISPSSSSYTHKVKWYRNDSYTTTVTLAAGVKTSTLSVPTNWPTGSASATLSTYSGSNFIGSYSYTFTITVNPASVPPTAGTLTVGLLQSAYIPSSWGVYVKGYSRARLTLSGSSAGGNGASYKSVVLTCGSQTQSTQSTMTFDTAELQETGSVSCSAKVTNVYGNAATSNTGTIMVYDYYEPIFNAISVFRCNSSGTPSDTGAYFGVTASVSIASVNSKNGLVSLQARYAPKGSTSWSTAQGINNGRLTIIGGAASGTSTYQVQVVAIDAVQNLRNTNSNATVTALTSEHVIFCMDGGLNVSFGMEGTKQNAVQINPNWHLYHGETQLDGIVPISRGGTNSTTAAAARTSLGITAANIGAVPNSGAALWQLANLTTANANYWGLERRVTTVASDSNGVIGIRVLNDQAQRVNRDTSGAYRGYKLFDASMTIPLANGGTGATSASAARTALGANNAANITTGTLPAARLPFKYAWGTANISGSSSASINYSSAGFTSTPYVFVTYSTTGSNWSGDNGAIKVHSKTTSGCSIVVGGNFNSSRSVDWFAIGT